LGQASLRACTSTLYRHFVSRSVLRLFRRVHALVAPSVVSRTMGNLLAKLARAAAKAAARAIRVSLKVFSVVLGLSLVAARDTTTRIALDLVLTSTTRGPQPQVKKNCRKWQPRAATCIPKIRCWRAATCFYKHDPAKKGIKARSVAITDDSSAETAEVVQARTQVQDDDDNIPFVYTRPLATQRRVLPKDIIYDFRQV